MKKYTKYLYLFTFMVILMALSACVQPTPTPPATLTPVPTAVPTPKPIQYLVMREDERTVVYTDYTNYIPLDATMRSGDAVPVSDSINWSGFMWYEVLCGHLPQFDVAEVGWVKFRDEKMYLEWRYP